MTEYWNISIQEGDDWKLYFTAEPQIIIRDNKEHIMLSAKYFGSSSRNDDCGTLYFLEPTISHVTTFSKNILVTDNKNNIIKEFHIPANKKIQHKHIWSGITIDDITVDIRYLHRYPKHPCEISGISFPK